MRKRSASHECEIGRGGAMREIPIYKYSNSGIEKYLNCQYLFIVKKIHEFSGSSGPLLFY